MKEKLVDMKGVFRFDETGTLPRPGPIGRLVRVLLGIALGAMIWDFIGRVDAADLTHPGLWFWAIFALMLAPYVVNIGWSMTLGAWPRIFFATLWLLAAVTGYVQGQGLLNNYLWWALDISLLYIFGHLGISFLLSGIIATPGCEMRAIPQLVGILRRNPTAEHYCPGFMRTVDQWELQLADTATPDETDPARRDWLASGKAKLVVYGIPFLLIQLAGNLAGLQVVIWTWGLGFGLPGLFCIVNALRSRRTHCYFVGPVLLAAGVLTFLMGFDVVDFGRSQFTYLLNITIIAVILLYTATERLFGQYLGNKAS